jgi:ferredoxin-NADP reductase
MMKLSDFRGLFRKTDIRLIQTTRHPDDQYEFDFKSDKLIPWRAGEHAAFTLPGKRVSGKTFRGFSIASIPDEGILKIATKIGNDPSSFKAHMRAMVHGDTIRLRGPFGWFTLQDEHSPVVLIAAGIGITPLRALMKEFEKGNKRTVSLIYSAKGEHLFKDELKAIADKDPQIKASFIHHRDESSKLINKNISAYGPSAYYYISGTRPMIKSIITKLRSKGIPRRQIITDPFFGY